MQPALKRQADETTREELDDTCCHCLESEEEREERKSTAKRSVRNAHSAKKKRKTELVAPQVVP